MEYLHTRLAGLPQDEYRAASQRYTSAKASGLSHEEALDAACPRATNATDRLLTAARAKAASDLGSSAKTWLASLSPAERATVDAHRAEYQAEQSLTKDELAVIAKTGTTAAKYLAHKRDYAWKRSK